MVDFGDFENACLVLSNVIFWLPAIECLIMRKHLFAFVFFAIFFTSSLYHACKYKDHDYEDPHGLCLILNFCQYFFLDHLFATLTVPCMFLSLTSLDVVVFDLGSWNEGKNKTPSSHRGPLQSKLEAFDKDNLKSFVFENASGGITPWQMRLLEDSQIKITTKKQSFGTKFLSNESSEYSIWRKLKENTVKANMSGVENLYICVYAYVIGVALLIVGKPNAAFYACLIVSCAVNTGIWMIYFYFEHGMVTGFKRNYLIPGLILGTFAVVLMAVQDYIPGDAYWVTHSLWHITGSLAQWLLLKSKYRYCCFY